MFWTIAFATLLIIATIFVANQLTRMALSFDSTVVDFPLGKSPVATVEWGYYYAGLLEHRLGLGWRLVL
ncbi:unnamed protein product [Colletotrichum noveboracense]|uniref:Uncharacterized protein n=1 Tax=Colletotrichum noveboracense TaxID=2664923 RepID=A0A9W4W5G0_9PEZI|nr:unnamed protein product [Colletotrichum noveboracense]